MMLFFVVVVMIFSPHVTSLQFGTCTSPSDHHVNSSWIGNSSCIPTRDVECRVFVKCRIKETGDLVPLLSYQNVVHTLDLSANNIEKIEDGIFLPFKVLVNLNLSHKSIRHIQRNAFSGLTNLQTLDLSFSIILSWDTVNIAQQLPSLTELDVTSNPGLSSVRRISSLPRLTKFKGVLSYTKPFELLCIFCSLTKNSYSPDFNNIDRSIYQFKSHCSRYAILPRYNLSSFWSLNFSITCEATSSKAYFCRKIRSVFMTSPYYSVHISHLCFKEINKWTLLHIPVGLVAMVINFTVMVTVIFKEHLRNNVALFFIANMAMGDFLQGLFLVSLTVTRRTISASTFFESLLSQSYVCSSFLTLFIIAQCLSVLVGFLVVLERYLCIVYSMNPDIRISKSIAKLFMIVVWFITISACSLPLALRMKLTVDDYSCVNVRTSEGKIFIEYLGIVCGFFYVLSYALYAHIFYTVRKSSLNVGLQREGKLAKRIMLVISSNLFFFLVPTMIILLFVNYETISNRVHLFVVWHTVGYFCLGINSCLNPLLYAFRNSKFVTELKKLLRYKQNVLQANPEVEPR